MEGNILRKKKEFVQSIERFDGQEEKQFPVTHGWIRKILSVITRVSLTNADKIS